MICKTCICHNKEALNPKVHSEDEVWCKRWKVVIGEKNACVYLSRVCGSCTKCNVETGER